MSFNFGGSSSTRRDRGTTQQQITLPAATETQKELEKLQLELAQLQKSEIQGAAKEREDFAKSPLAQTQREIEELASTNILNRLKGTAPVLTPDQQAYLDQIYGTALKRGEADLMRFGQQMAAGRGMNVTDSPIGSELIRQRGEFGEGLETARAKSALDLGSAGQEFASNLAGFREQLRQQAFQNRLALGGLQPGFTQFAGMQSAERRAQPNIFAANRGTTGMTGFNYGGGASYQQGSGWGGGLAR